MSTSNPVTYTYTKVIKNPSIMMSTVEKVFGPLLNYYDYDISTSTLSITFRESLSANKKEALDTLVNVYVENAVLTTNDVNAFKNIRAYKSSDQILPTTLNSVAEVLFQSTTTIQRLYYQMSGNGKYIYIQKPGTYLVIAKVGACLADDALPGTNSVLQWGISYDDSRAEFLYINIPNSYVYTVHTNINSMNDSTMLCAVFTVNSINGTYFRLTAKQILGTTPLMVDNDLTSISIMSIPGASFYEGNSTTVLTLAKNTFTNVTLGNDRIKQYPFTHVLGSQNVTVSQSGYVLYIGKATFNKTTGSDGSIGNISLLLNGTRLSNVGAFSIAVSAPSNKSTSHFIGVTAVNANDVFAMQATMIQGSSLQTTSGETGLILVYIHPAIFAELSLVFSTSDMASGNLSTAATDLTFNKTIANNEKMSASGSTYIVTEPGIYLVAGNITFNNGGNITREGGVYISQSVDSGKTFYYTLSTLGIKQLTPGEKTTVPNFGLVPIPGGGRFKIQATTNGLTTDTITTTDTSQLTVLNFSKEVNYGKSIYFGDHYDAVSASDSLVVDKASWVEKCRLVYSYLDAGIYRVTSTMSVSTEAVLTNITFQLIDVYSNNGTMYIVYNRTVSYPAGTFYFQTTDFVTAAEGAHVLILQVSSPDAVEFTCKETIMDCWRVF